MKGVCRCLYDLHGGVGHQLPGLAGPHLDARVRRAGQKLRPVRRELDAVDEALVLALGALHELRER